MRRIDVVMEIVSVYDMRPSSGRKRSASQEPKIDPEVEREQDICRHVINTELMMLHGHSVDGYLPPLPQQEKTKTRTASAWDCANPALRQLSSMRRRSNRSIVIPSTPPQKNLDTREIQRPHTSYCDYVRGVLNTKPDDIRPQTAGIVLDSDQDPNLSEHWSITLTADDDDAAAADDDDELYDRNSEPKRVSSQGWERGEGAKLDFSNIKRLLPFLIMKDRLGELRDDITLDYADLQSEVPSTVGLTGGGLRKPKLGLLKKKKSNKGKGMRSFLDLDQQLNDNIARVLKGDLDNLPCHPPTSVRVYLCSHSNDMLVERKILEAEAYPELREYSQKLGLEFQIIDTHLEGLDDNPADILYRRRQLNKCQNQSVGPNFVVLLGDYYGSETIPLSFCVKDYKFLHKAASVSTNDSVDATLLEECYKLDENLVPAAYVLQHPEQMSSTKCTQLRFILRESVFTAIQIGKFLPEREIEFSTSELEHLLRDGILRNQGDLSAVRCLCFHRKFQGMLDDLDNEAIAKFVDVKIRDGKLKVDNDKQDRLYKLIVGIRKQLGESNMKGYEVTWTGGDVMPDKYPEHQVYVKRLVRDFIDGMKRLIDLNHSQWKGNNPNFILYREVLHHSKECEKRFFADRPGPFAAIQQFFNADDNVVNRPLVLYGTKGIGKSSILAEICKRGGQLVDKPQWVSIYRQVRLTPDSSELRTLLVNICQQLAIIYNMDPPSEADCRSANGMVRIFASTLEIISKHSAAKRPLFLLLDDVHKLPSKDRADTFFWLPRVCPKNVHIVLTLNGDEAEKLNKLRRRIDRSKNFIQINIMDKEEASMHMKAVLVYHKREVTSSQDQMLKALIAKGVHPMLLQLYAHDILKWPSSYEPDDGDLPDTVHDEFVMHMEHLQSLFGPCLVRTVIMYLSLLPTGITEVELGDACITTSAVIKEARIRSRISSHLLYTQTRTNVNRIADYLESLGLIRTTCFHNRTLLSWSNELIGDIACQMYFGVTSTADLHESTNDAILECHSHLRELFSQQTGLWLEDRHLYAAIGVCTITPHLLISSNIRKLNLLPYLISQCVMVENEDMETYLKRKCLCDYMWLLIKLQATGFTNYLADLKLIKGHDLEIDLVLDFVSLCGYGLQQSPLSLALQMLGTMPYMNASRYPLVAEMIEVAKAWMMDQKFPLLVPAFMCFPSPLDQCKAKLWSIVDIQIVNPMTNLGVVKNKDGFLEIWDMVRQEWVYQTGIKYDKVTLNVFATEQMVLGVNAPQSAQVWEIETGFEVYNVQLSKVFRDSDNITCHAHTERFDKLAFHTCDDDFNQSFVVVNSESGSVELSVNEFGLKDEFFPQSAAFATIDGHCWLVFINARSEIVAEDLSEDFVKLNVYDINFKRHKHTIMCGSKKFDKLLTKNNKYAIVCWADCSFDVYNIVDGSRFSHLSSPDSDLVVQASAITEDGYLVALASSTPENRRDGKIYYGLWFWNVEECSSSELFVEEQPDQDHVPKHFVIIEELHLAVLGSRNSARISVWDLPTSTCIYSFDSHVGGLDRIVKSPDPYRIYTCSAGERLVKIWDIYNLVTCAKDQDSQKDLESEAFDMPSIISSRDNSVISNRTEKEKTPESIMKPNSRMKSGRSTRKSVRFAEFAEIADDISMDEDDSLHPSDSVSVVESRTSGSKPHPPDDRHLPAQLCLPDGDADMNEYSYSAAGSTANMEISDLHGLGSGSMVSGDGFSSVDDTNEMEAVVYGNTGQITMHSQLENMFDVTIMHFTKDSEFVITGSQKGLPTIWDVKTGFPHLHMERQAEDDVCTPWITLACKDKYIVGLTGKNKPYKDGWPPLYKFQVWKRVTGKAHIPTHDMDDIFVIKCAALSDGERVLISILDKYKPGEKAGIRMEILHIERMEVLRRLRVFLPELPDIQQVTGDNMYTILISPNKSCARTYTIIVYNLEDEMRGELPTPCHYEFKEGSKFKKYGATSNIILRNGVSLAAGLNGDLQLWDIATGEYEGNLYHDPNVKDKSNPGLHNHNGKQIHHMALSEDGRYLICGGGDGTTSLWDLDNEVMMHSYQGHKDEVRRVMITWDNQLVLTAGADCMLFVWPFAGDRPICQLFIHVVATDLQISEDKKTVCVIGNRQNEDSRFMMFRLMNLRKLT
ncbi:hypothetical protein LSH36_942g01049 [Paralvinella palmiformis]|uniref:NWD1/2-like winged helix-turn-helix domain-containing protein n=1 Tax=Paralvinella palmiformis TaxID=53620 RepID=A0AAD9IX10_9ANNE|nr:hypothetical protein LSH36_942g01049 [Paralvinella palmiformis]